MIVLQDVHDDSLGGMDDSENLSDWDASESLRSGKSVDATGGGAKKNTPLKSAGE